MVKANAVNTRRGYNSTAKYRRITMPKQVVLKFPVELPEEGALDKKALKKGKKP